MLSPCLAASFGLVVGKMALVPLFGNLLTISGSVDLKWGRSARISILRLLFVLYFLARSYRTDMTHQSGRTMT